MKWTNQTATGKTAWVPSQEYLAKQEIKSMPHVYPATYSQN